MQFLASPCHYYSNSSSSHLGASSFLDSAAVLLDFGYLLLSLLRLPNPPPGLFQAMHDISLNQPTTWAALIVARFLEGDHQSSSTSTSTSSSGDGSSEVANKKGSTASSSSSSSGSASQGAAVVAACGGANDEGRSLGLRLLTVYMARLSAQTSSSGLGAAIRRNINSVQSVASSSSSSHSARFAGPSGVSAKFYTTGLTLIQRSLTKHQVNKKKLFRSCFVDSKAFLLLIERNS